MNCDSQAHDEAELLRLWRGTARKPPANLLFRSRFVPISFSIRFPPQNGMVHLPAPKTDWGSSGVCSLPRYSRYSGPQSGIGIGSLVSGCRKRSVYRRSAVLDRGGGGGRVQDLKKEHETLDKYKTTG